MPFAAKSKIAFDSFEGAIEITEEQYLEALEGMQVGLDVTIEGGFKVAAPVPPTPPPEPVPTTEQLIERFRAVIQEHMDAEEPTVPKFQAEGKALRAWRSLVWAYGYEQIDAVQSGARSLPTPEELIAELPPLVMP